MGKVAIDNLVPGMVLSGDLRDRNGRLLLKAGTELTERCLYLLHTWGAVEADIENGGDDREPPGGREQIDPELWASLEKEIAPLFRHTDINHPAIKELMRIRIMQEAGNGDR